MEDKQLSPNFKLSEFKYVPPAPELLEVLQRLRDNAKYPITIISAGRSVLDHISEYKSRYGSDWINHIAWDSRHLATYKEKYLGQLRAVDITIMKENNIYLSGDEIKERILLSKPKEISVGLGIASHSLHLDVDRETYTEWRYNY